MKLKNILMLVLALCMVFTLCACGEAAGNNNESTAGTTDSTTQNTTEGTTADDGKVTYTVKVVDEGGNPIAGAMVQLCLEACVPALTNAEGVATYNLAEEDYKVSFVTMPEGYTADEAEYHFADGSYEMTITLKAVA